jgi:hypothetical protein
VGLAGARGGRHAVGEPAYVLVGALSHSGHFRACFASRRRSGTWPARCTTSWSRPPRILGVEDRYRTQPNRRRGQRGPVGEASSSDAIRWCSWHAPQSTSTETRCAGPARRSARQGPAPRSTPRSAKSRATARWPTSMCVVTSMAAPKRSLRGAQPAPRMKVDTPPPLSAPTLATPRYGHGSGTVAGLTLPSGLTAKRQADEFWYATW